MKKYIVFMVVFITCLFVFSGCKKEEKKLTDLDVIKNRGYIIIGVKSDSYPFGYKNSDNRREGIDIEISKEIAKRIFNVENSDGKIEYVDVTPQNRISKLNSKEVDILVATVSINEKRRLVINFSTPYFTTGQKIMVRNNSKIKTLTYFNSQGKLCIVLGTTGEKIAHLNAPNANVIGVKTYKEAYNLLKNGEVDAILGDSVILNGLINLNDGKFKIVNRSYSNEQYAVATRKSEDSTELLDNINLTIAEILSNNKINSIKSNYKI